MLHITSGRLHGVRAGRAASAMADHRQIEWGPYVPSRSISELLKISARLSRATERLQPHPNLQQAQQES